jgi:hypothetical protein
VNAAELGHEEERKIFSVTSKVTGKNMMLLVAEIPSLLQCSTKLTNAQFSVMKTTEFVFCSKYQCLRCHLVLS